MILTRTESGEGFQQGGVVRVVHGAPEAETPMQAVEHTQPVRALSGPLRFDGNEVVSAGVVRYRVGSEPSASRSIMSTAQRVNGMLTVETVPGVPASRTVIETAVREGLVRETAPGFYEDVLSAAASGESEQSVQEADAAGEESLFDPTEAAIWAQEIEPLTQQSYDAAVAGTIAAIVSQRDSLEGVARSLAEANGMEPADALEYVETGIEWFTRTLTRDLVRHNLVTERSAQEFYDSVRGSPHLQQALLEFAVEGKTNTFRALALNWKRAKAATTADSIREKFASHGMQISVDHSTGEVMVKAGGGPWVPLTKLK